MAADVRRAAALGWGWVTFDMPRADVAGMVTVMERFSRDVKPAVREV